MFKKYFLDQVINNYANFSGRVTRKEFWMYLLIQSLIGFAFVVLVLIGLSTMSFSNETSASSIIFLFGGAILAITYTLVTLIPTISMEARRLHDAGYSGWWILISVIPYLGGIALIVLLCLKSDGNNIYGHRR